MSKHVKHWTALISLALRLSIFFRNDKSHLLPKIFVYCCAKFCANFTQSPLNLQICVPRYFSANGSCLSSAARTLLLPGKNRDAAAGRSSSSRSIRPAAALRKQGRLIPPLLVTPRAVVHLSGASQRSIGERVAILSFARDARNGLFEFHGGRWPVTSAQQQHSISCCVYCRNRYM